MGSKPYTAKDIDQLSTEINQISPRLRPLLLALVELGLGTIPDGGSENIKIQLDEPDNGAARSFKELIANSFTPGPVPKGTGPVPKGGRSGTKVGDTMSALKVGDSILINRSTPGE